MAKQLLKLLAAQYDQPVLDKDGGWNPLTGATVRRSRGETFEANSQEEYDRLTADSGVPGDDPAALDPDEANKREKADLERRRAALEAERDAIDAQLAAAVPSSDLKGDALDSALASHGLSTEGKADEKRARLQEYLDANPGATPAA